MKKKTQGSRNKSERSRFRKTTRATRKVVSRKTSAGSKVSTGQKSASANRSEGLQQYKLAGRPTCEQFQLVYGPRGHLMTWTQRAAAGIPAEKFQAALASAMRK